MKGGSAQGRIDCRRLGAKSWFHSGIRENGSGGGVVMARMEMSAAPQVKGYIAPENVTISKTITMEIELVDGAAQ